MPFTQKLLISLLMLASVALSWSGILERSADAGLRSTLERALLTAAIARGLNGVISVAQGTEIAIAPVGIGVTLAAGQILDPLNDLVERFSWLALAASASLGTQLLLTEIFAESVFNYLVSALVGVYLLLLWWPGNRQFRGWLLRTTVLFIFVRFVFTLVGLTVAAVDVWVLESRQQVAMNELSQTTQNIETLQTAARPQSPTESSIREQFELLIDSSRQMLNIEAQFQALQATVESSIEHLIDLMVLFLVQTFALPLAAMWVAITGFRWIWGWTTNNRYT